MKIRNLMAAAAVAAVCALPAMADNEWGVMGTFWSPSDGDDVGGGGVKVGIEMADRVQLDLRWSTYSDVLGTPAGSPDVDVEPLEFGLSYSVPLNSDVEAAYGAGLGHYMMDGAGTSDETGFYLSAGLEWTINRSGATYGETAVKLFADALYRFVEAEGTFVEADLDGPAVQLGMLIAW